MSKSGKIDNFSGGVLIIMVPHSYSSIFRVIKRFCHVPVMTNEVLDALKPCSNQTFLDMTFGYGGHSSAILSSSDDSVRVFGLDRDPNVVERMEYVQKRFGSARFIPLQGSFSQIPALLKPYNVSLSSLSGILLDLGASSMQMDSTTRGFGVSHNSPLDMRMNPNEANSVEARHVLNSLELNELTKIFRAYGEEKWAGKIARAIVEYRGTVGPINYTKQLAEIVESVVDRHSQDRLGRYSHSATRIFMALRIFVNNELNELVCALDLSHKLLRHSAPCVVISFHSLEDRIVKWIFQNRTLERIFAEDLDPGPQFGGQWSVKSDFLAASQEELEVNPRARSAKLRIALKA